MRRAETQRTLVRERETQIRSKGRKRNALRGTAECRLRAVMLLMLFCVRRRALHHTWVFLLAPSPMAPSPSPVACCLPGPPAASLIYWFSASCRAINHGIRGRRWLDCSAQRDREKRKEATDGLEKEKEEEGEGGPRSLCVQQTGYWWCLFLPGLYLCRGHVLPGVIWKGYALGTHELCWNYPGTAIYIRAQQRCLFWLNPLYQPLLLRWTEGEWGNRVGVRWAHGKRTYRLMLLDILPPLKLHLCKCVDFSLI